MSRHAAAVFLVMLWLLVPADPALAQVNDILRRALEGTVTGAIQNEVNNPQVTTSAKTATSTREENRQIQMALNHFGYPAGTADGILGRRSRAAIAKFQSSNGHSATGTLTNPQKSALLSSWQRSASGTPVDSVDLLGVIGAGQLILNDSSVSAGRRRQQTTTTTTATAGTGATGDTILPDSGQAVRRERRQTVVSPTVGSQTGSTTIASPFVATEPSPRSATRGEQTGESIAVTTTRRTSTSSNTATTERRETTTSNTTTTTVQPADSQNATTRSTGSPPASSAEQQLRCQQRGIDPSACVAGN